MQKQLEQILKRLAKVESEVKVLQKVLKSEKLSADVALNFERLPDTATVGKDYVCYRFKCSMEAIRRGRSKTDRLRKHLVSKKPMKWIKRDVDVAWNESNKSTTELALEEISKAGAKKRKSIITRKPVL